MTERKPWQLHLRRARIAFQSCFELSLGQFVNGFDLGGTSYHESLILRSRKQGASPGQCNQNKGDLHAFVPKQPESVASAMPNLGRSAGIH